MAYSSYRSSRYDSLSPPPRYRSRSRSRSQSPTRDYSDDESAYNPGNNLYITGLSSRASQRDLEDHFLSEGKVLECHLVVDPRTKESRGFGFVTMDSVESAERCIKHLNKSVLEGRVISVEKAKRKRARTPTPGKYLGVRTSRGSSSYDYERGRGYDGRRSPQYSPYRTSRDYSPDYSPYRGGNRYRDRSPYASGSRYRDRSRSPRYSPYRYRSEHAHNVQVSRSVALDKVQKLVALDKVNETMKANQDSWQLAIKAAEAREKTAIKESDDRILELEEQVRKLMISMEAQRVLETSGPSERRDGTILSFPATSAQKQARRSTKAGGKQRR
ncbi:hypothetical protein L7F22_013864 [Adiantum nelumboides]|nr:hypothetical protein [Adiantum nelumboides]